MEDLITEALLEMHYHESIKGFFQKTYGANFLRLLKPDPRLEAWVGFDQGWVRIEVGGRQFLDELRHAIQSGTSVVDRFYLGFFLQFKKVRRITRGSKYMPPWYHPPYFRSEISVKRNKSTGLSQHQTLLRLCHINSASVCYACPMLFSAEEIYEPADLARLRCIDLVSAPTGWTADERHFVTFQHPSDAVGLWCSDATRAPVWGFDEWASPAREDGMRRLSAEETLSLIRNAGDVIRDASPQAQREWFGRSADWPLRVLPRSFTILEFSASTEDIRNT